MLGAIWKAATEEVKAPYVQAEAEARRRYGRAMEEYRTQGTALHHDDHEPSDSHYDPHAYGGPPVHMMPPPPPPPPCHE